MKHKLLLSGAMVALAVSAQAQSIKEGYVEWPNSSSLPTYVSQWTPGESLFNDENFFISRVAPKQRFRNAATQVDPTINESNDKRVVFWVPIGDDLPVRLNAIQNGKFDSEAFSMWSYLSHYGNWTSPYGWVPGAFADVAHKNGVAASGVASIPFGALTTEWSNCLNAMSNVDKEKLARFLHYHGVDGLGYNSEFSGGSALPGLRDVHAYLMDYMKDVDPLFENMWYDGTNDNGSISFDQGLGSHNQLTFGDSENPRSSLFFNYNWNRASLLESSVNKAQSLGHSPLYLYAGHNMQGNEPGPSPTVNNWELLSNYPISVGLWGAHQQNMIWQNRNSNGSSPEVMQDTYLTNLERFFTNGNRNPANKIEEFSTGMSPSETFHGMSRFMTAQSSLKWDLNDEPFITYFNIGNGKLFNWEGQRVSDNEWYSIGVQDYLPTWRWWWADKFLGRTAADVPADGLTAGFTWEDAYNGGSCIKITGSSSDEYLHLFKTEFKLANKDVITVRYKHTAGNAKVSLILSVKGSESDIVAENNLVVLTADTQADNTQWTEKTFNITGALTAKLNNKEVAVVGLHFTDAKDLEFYLGEFSIVRKSTPTPQAPKVSYGEMLSNNLSGVDGKIIFNMTAPAGYTADQPVYNLDVNTSLFKLYTRQGENGEPQFMGATTSWAGLVFSAPYDYTNSEKMYIGVSAVSTDFKSESAISWSKPLDVPAYEVTNDIALSQAMLKPGEAFEVGYVDPRHEDGTFTIYDHEGKQVAQGTGHSLKMAEGLPTVGGYDLIVNDKDGERRFNYYIQITKDEVGAMPAITGLSVNDVADSNDEIKLEVLQNVKLGYTGREANGSASRGINILEKWAGVNAGALELDAYQTFSVAAWVKFDELPSGLSSFLTIETRSGTWPANNWGFFWSRINEDGTFIKDQIDTAWGARLDSNADGWRFYETFGDTKLTAGAWSHVVFVFEFNEDHKFRIIFYVNGVKQTATKWTRVWKMTQESYGWEDILAEFAASDASRRSDAGTNTTDPDFVTTEFPIGSGDWIAFGGSSLNISAMTAVIDDFQVWDKAMTEEDVKLSMNGLDGDNLPANVLAYWDFETDCDSDYGFPAKGKKAGVKFYRYYINEQSGEGQGLPVPTNPIYDAGCPFISGTNYQIETKPTWNALGSVVTDAEGNDLEGSANVAFRKEGSYNVELQLSNNYGTAVATYPVVTVSGYGNVATVGADADVEVYNVNDAILLQFGEAGNYNVTVANAAGMVVASKAANVEAGQAVQVGVGATGVYLVNVTRDGKVVRTVKLLKK